MLSVIPGTIYDFFPSVSLAVPGRAALFRAKDIEKHAVTLTWSPPLEPNGFLTSYILQYQLSTSITSSLRQLLCASFSQSFLCLATRRYHCATNLRHGSGVRSAELCGGTFLYSMAEPKQHQACYSCMRAGGDYARLA